VPMQPAALYAHRDVPAVDPDAASDTTRPKPRLKLAIPELAPGPDWQAPPLPAATAEASPPAVREQAPAGADEARPAEPRLAGVQAHFALMNEFLDSQSRVLGLSHPKPAADADASTTDTHYPLIGKVVRQETDRLVAEHTISLGRERYLRDHCLSGAASTLDTSLSGLSVVPFTFSMEM